MAKRYHTPIQIPLPIEGLTIAIPLTKGQVTVVDAVDADLAQFNWVGRLSRNYSGGGKYVVTRGVPGGNGKFVTQYMHRLILSRMLGRELTRFEYVDHADLDPLNNRRSNLRLATPSQNAANKRKYAVNTSSKFKGVTREKNSNRWVAYIRFQQKDIRLGTFDTEEEAHAAYCKAAKELFGEFARFE